MEHFWSVLGLEPTQDISVIRRAYAQKTKACHPEEDPAGFLKLREAYQAAIEYAERSTGSSKRLAGNAGFSGAAEGKAGLSGSAQENAGLSGLAQENAGLPGLAQDDAGPSGSAEGDERGTEAEEAGWTLSLLPKRESGSNPYTDHPAVQNFRELYTGRQRKDQNRWLDYFTSDAFLDVAWEPRFTALLLDNITRLEKEYPVNREFLIWLCVAYQFTVHRAVYRNPDGSERAEFQFQIRPEVQFDGQESVFEIATKGPTPKKPRGNELAMFESFAEYRLLLSMAEKNVWSEREIGKYSQIIGCYAAIYITDKCQQRGDMDYERHPAGLRLMTHFFRREGLPEELYRITWQKLNLETAVMGREKLFYGSLRQLILDRMPELAGMQRERFEELRAQFFTYAVETCKAHGKNAQATQEDIRRTDEFFAREDFQRALLDRRFVEEEILHTWVDEDRCDYYLEKMIRFYTEHETAPCARQVIDRAREMQKYQEIADRLQKDQEAEISEDAMTLKNSPFFRHWLNTGFYQAQDPESGRRLLEYLNQELPYLPEWSRKFLEVTEEDIVPRSAACVLGEDTLEICFHLRYMEFWLNREPVYRACLDWEHVAGLTDTDLFFFCLPVTVTVYDQYEAVKAEILRRLRDTAAPEDRYAFIAACLAERVCSLPMPGEAGLAWDLDEEENPRSCSLPRESALSFEIFAENTEHLYGCEWIERSQALFLFEQLPIGRQLLGNGQGHYAADAESALALARQLLRETLTPPGIPMKLLVNLPEEVYATPDFRQTCTDEDLPLDLSRPVELLGKDVTRKKLAALLTCFADGRLNRLEWSWKTAAPAGEDPDYDFRRSLVFLKEGGRYVCLYFDDYRAKSYALLEKPELYGKMNDSVNNSPELVVFRGGKLFNDVIHRSFSSIRRHLDVIFRQVSWPNNVDYMAGGIWDYAVNVSYGRAKYNLDKQCLADFPLKRALNRLDAVFYFSIYPDLATWMDEQGNVETMEVNQAKRGQMQQMLIRFLQGGFRRLRLTFGKEAGRQKHIVLLQDAGRFLVAWLEEEKQTAQYHVADTGTYMDVEGKKYPRDTFQGKVTPAYLIHNDAPTLRAALELLLANMDQPDRITGQFAEYANEKPVKARPYEVLWAELVQQNSFLS